MISLITRRNFFICHVCRAHLKRQIPVESTFNNARAFSSKALHQTRDFRSSLTESPNSVAGNLRHVNEGIDVDSSLGEEHEANQHFRNYVNGPLSVQRAAWNSHLPRDDTTYIPTFPLELESSELQNAETVSAVSNLLKARIGSSEVRWTPPAQRSSEKNTKTTDGSVPKVKSKWEDMGLRPVLAQAIQRAFPDAIRTTKVQGQLVSALLKGYSTIVNDLPGTGKSFAIAMWLMSLERSRSTKTSAPSTTALVLAPNTELVKQYHAHILALLNATGSKAIIEKSASFVQALYRSQGEGDEDEQLQVLQENPNPHIVIATPTRLLDLLSHDNPKYRELIDYQSFKALVLEESDAALDATLESGTETPKQKLKPKEKLKEKLKEHKDPLVIFLDYIFNLRRQTTGLNKRPMQPQLVVPTSVTGPTKMKKNLTINHPLWLDGDNRPGFTPFTGKGRRSLASTMMTIRPAIDEGIKFPRKVSQKISHHIVAYNTVTGSLRDAPLPTYKSENQVERAILNSDIFEEQLQDKLSTEIDNAEDEHTLDALIASYQHMVPEATRSGYPTSIAVDVVATLLQHDNYPRNVIVNLGENSSQRAFIKECATRGIRARHLTTTEWNNDKDTKYPVGRTDRLVGATFTEGDLQGEQGGDKNLTTVWVTNYSSCRGVDFPGIYHSYILHRIEKARVYITYCGHVAKWPFSPEEEKRDPRSLGKEHRHGGKVVSVLLEQPEGSALEEVNSKPCSVVRLDGSKIEAWEWQRETLRLAKLGLTIDKYFV
ncbi:hypothetical protein EDC01DRAFT_664849 [Geopyxis carbonaria]|nr:hypothetical protein EDC01DRAFT_664849 [Geopyxis carbonaria]